MASKKFELYKADLTSNIGSYSEELTSANAELVALFSYYTGLIPKYAAEILGALKGHDHTENEDDHCLTKALHYIPAGQLRLSGNKRGQVKSTRKEDYQTIIDGIIALIGGVVTLASETLVEDVKSKLGLNDATADLDKDGKVDDDDVKIAKAIVSTVEFEEVEEPATQSEEEPEEPEAEEPVEE